MPHLETFGAFLRCTTGGIYISVNHYSLLHELIEFVRQIVPTCSVSFRDNNAVWINRLDNRDTQIGDAIVDKLLWDGWQCLQRQQDHHVFEYTFSRVERFTSVVDDFDRLLGLLCNNTVSQAEFEAMKRRLID